jgi:hypothetical protein
MAKVIAPFKIVGTLEDLTFYLDQEKNNLVKTKGNPGITSKQFYENPIFERVRNHGQEFGKCAKKSQNFRAIALKFYNRAKDVSFAGRANKLMLEIMNEDIENKQGERTVENGLKSEEARTFFRGFEGNKTRTVSKVLKTKYQWNDEQNQLTISKFNPKKHLLWPETECDNIHLAVATANWNYEENKFCTEYSEELIINKEEKPTDIVLKTKQPEGNELKLVFLFIGFSIQERKKVKELKRSNNTATIIWSK